MESKEKTESVQPNQSPIPSENNGYEFQGRKQKDLCGNEFRNTTCLMGLSDKDKDLPSPIPSENNGIKFKGRKKYRAQQMKELWEAIEARKSITPPENV